MTYRQLLKNGEDILAEAHVPDAAFDARELFLFAFSLNTAELLLKYGEVLKENDNRAELFMQYISKRKDRIPLQHIIGECVFMGLPFFVNEDVLIPRPDTEILVEKVLSEIESIQENTVYGSNDRKKADSTDILDLCTGSGCIAIALKKYGGEKVSVTASDISEKALETAEKNAARNGTDIALVKSDLFEAFSKKCETRTFESVTQALAGCYGNDDRKKNSFDIIVSNPPYIKDGDIRGLEPEVKDHDPYIALSGGEDGLYFYRKIADAAGAHLNEKGKLFFEIGFDQARAVSDILETAGFTDIGVIRDLSGNDRVVFAGKTKQMASDSL